MNATEVEALVQALVVEALHNSSAATLGEQAHPRPASDSGWMLSRAVGILSMQGGFALLEAGSVRAANRGSIMMKNVADMSVGLLTYLSLGHLVAWGTDYSPSLSDDTDYTHLFFQYSFATTCCTILSGSMAERAHFSAYVAFSTIYVTLIYPLVVRATWASGGFLLIRGFTDFAGCGVVHLTGGVGALVGTVALGPRTGRFGHRRYSEYSPWALLAPPLQRARKAASRWAGLSPGGESSNSQRIGGNRRQQRVLSERQNRTHEFELSDPVHVVFGTFVLWVGWFNFNMGSTMGLTEGRDMLAAKVGMVTAVGGGGGGVAGCAYALLRRRRVEVGPAAVGILAGLVSITGACACMQVWLALPAAMVGAGLACWSSDLLASAYIDDPANAVPVHLVGGMWGLVVTGLVAREDRWGVCSHSGLLEGGGGGLLGTELWGGLAIALLSGLLSLVALVLIDHSPCGPLRVGLTMEREGLDSSEHGIFKKLVAAGVETLETVSQTVVARLAAHKWMARAGIKSKRTNAKGLTGAPFQASSRKVLGVSSIAKFTNPSRNGAGKAKSTTVVSTPERAPGEASQPASEVRATDSLGAVVIELHENAERDGNDSLDTTK